MKSRKVRANQKSSDIIRDLTSIARQDGEATGDVIPAAAVDGGAEPRGVAGDPEQEGELVGLRGVAIILSRCSTTYGRNAAMAGLLRNIS